MELNSLIIIKNELEKYKLTHPKLYNIFKVYIKKHETTNLLFIKNLTSSINNLENIDDLTIKELYILNNIYTNIR